MSAATTKTNDVLAGPVLIVVPGLQGHVAVPGNGDYEQAYHPCCALEPISLGHLSIVATGNRPSFDLLDLADATWEDAEWQ